MAERKLELHLQGYGLTTAHILYRLPDFPTLLQSYIWQEYDLAPRFPRLRGFLRFWESDLEGAIHSVRVACAELVKPAEFRFATGEFGLH